MIYRSDKYILSNSLWACAKLKLEYRLRPTSCHADNLLYKDWTSVRSPHIREPELSAKTALLPSDQVGTMEYMAPEVLQKESASFASDMYAWAVTVNEAACGVFPYSDCMRDEPQAQTVLNFNYDRCAAPST